MTSASGWLVDLNEKYCSGAGVLSAILTCSLTPVPLPFESRENFPSSSECWDKYVHLITMLFIMHSCYNRTRWSPRSCWHGVTGGDVVASHGGTEPPCLAAQPWEVCDGVTSLLGNVSSVCFAHELPSAVSSQLPLSALLLLCVMHWNPGILPQFLGFHLWPP